MWYRTPLRCFLGLMVIGGILACVKGVAGSPPNGARTAAPVLSPVVPADLPANPTQADAVNFAWQSFVAVNWPALVGVRGIPDPKKKIGQAGDVVWDTWKTPGEVFTKDGQPPPAWNQPGGTPPPECRIAGAVPTDFWLQRLTKVPGSSNNGAMQKAKEVVGGTLTDQHGNLVRFDVRLNRAEFVNIVANVYYNTQGQDRAAVINFPSGVMEVKAAWRELTDSDPPAVKARFFRRNAWIYTPGSGPTPPSCIHSEVGLVGLHVTQKTPSQPQWTWATFEQIDNVPPFVPPSGVAVPAPRTLPYSFNNPACPPSICVPNQSTEKNGKPTGIPTQVTRVVNLGTAAQQANPLWQAALRSAVLTSPFQYYELVDVQWPQNPAQRPAGNPTPGLLANTTMETYVVESSCLNCHYTARTASGKLSSDFSFLLAEAHPKQAAR
jgi:hypothetical protein